MIAVIINPISGGGGPGTAARRVELARAALARCGEEMTIAVSERRGHARELAAAAVARGARLVMAWGGDGTMNEVGSALVSGPAALAIVPSGSGNGLARELQVPRDPVQAIAAALRSTPRVIDSGELGGRPFFNMAGIGFDAHIASRFDQAPRRGFATYVRVSARELLTYRSATYTIDAGPADGDPQRVALRESIDDPGTVARRESDTCRATLLGSPQRRALLIAFANSPQFGNGARIAPAARLDDGRLDLVVFEEVSRLATFWALPRLFAGGLEGIRGLSSQQIQRATIESDKAMTFHVDGEPVQGGTTLEARVIPRALRVCA